LTHNLKLAVGDIVVYRSHGAGPVTARESRVILGKPQEVIVLALAHGLRVELPLHRAHQLLRPLATESDISRVQETLSTDQALSRDSWLKRQRETLSSLNDGDPIGLARIIRNSTRRQAARSPKDGKPPQSLWEREIATKARSLLSTEIAYALAIEPDEANSWIDQQLSQRP
jgi:CarD family transcriptional regulator, regulator of rRNA transcription